MSKTATLNDLKIELWLRQRESDNIIWTTKNGDKISIRKMSDSHLTNAIVTLEKQYQKENDFLEVLGSLGDTEIKQGEKKPTVNTEPKFKIGDWITNGEYTWKVTDIKPLDYILQSQNGDIVDDTISYVDEEFHLWTIQDAKDGDVLYHKSPLTGIEYIVMSKGVNSYGNVDSYFRYNSIGGFDIGVSSVFNTKEDITPATKEQHDLLFQKMKEAGRRLETGYEWDAKKKELKKIEQKPSITVHKFRVGDNVKAVNEEPLIITKIDDKGYWSGELFICDFDEEACWDLVEQDSAWSEKDETNMDAVWRACGQAYGTDYQGILGDWLKSLKDRFQLQPKQEWSEDDEKMRKLLINILNVNHPNGFFKVNEIDDANMQGIHKDTIVDWLKSLKPNYWKPSEYDISLLEEIARNIRNNVRPFCSEVSSLEDLIKNLKTL